MARIPGKACLPILAGLLLILPLLAGCGGEDSTGESNGEKEPPEITTITIGYITDQTGASATAMEPIDMALDDAVEYYTENGLIPEGARLEVATCDCAYEPSKEIPCYEKVKRDGADLIFSNVPTTPLTLKPRVTQDEMVLFTTAADDDLVYPPGYIFVPSTLPSENAYTLLKWVAENDSDFPADRRAKIGAAGWKTPYNIALQDAMKEYAEAHPDKFEWVGGYTIEIGFNWKTEVEALKECDYIMLPISLVSFVKEYRGAGYDGKFMGTGAQSAFLGTISDAHLWDKFDGSLFILPSGWWTDDTEIINMTKQLLFAKHPDSAEEIMGEGASYISIDAIYQILDIIVDAIEEAGPGGFDSEALYQAAEAYSQTVDGIERASFGKNKRSSIDHLAIYEVNGEEKDLFRVHDEWYPVVRSPAE
ncbi:MAG: ABC transporter substrate-binding protein [Dehalococcoidia bacterium]